MQSKIRKKEYIIKTLNSSINKDRNIFAIIPLTPKIQLCPKQRCFASTTGFCSVPNKQGGTCCDVRGAKANVLIPGVRSTRVGAAVFVN